MLRSNRELWMSFIAILVITLFYLGVVAITGSVPAAREFFGHSLGVIGLTMMLMTETLYTLRKRSRSSRWGRMASWLQFHIFTGLVGPYLALLHTAWNFNGLAGVVMLLPGVVVFSGVVGRSIYTAVPRTADGIELDAQDIEGQIRAAEEEVQRWIAQQTAATQALASSLASRPLVEGKGFGIVLDRAIQDWRDRREWAREERRQDAAARAKMTQLEELVRQRNRYRRQLDSLATARRLLSIWHIVHVPLGLSLFAAAFIHVGAAIYYATLLR